MGGALIRARLASNFLPARQSDNLLPKTNDGLGMHPRTSNVVQTKVHTEGVMRVLLTAGSMIDWELMRTLHTSRKTAAPNELFADKLNTGSCRMREAAAASAP